MTESSQSPRGQFGTRWFHKAPSILPEAKELIADKGYDADWFRETLAQRKIVPCIPSKSNRKVPIPHDAVLYRQRHKIEIMFGRIKDWRRVHTRYDRCAHTYFSAICIAVWLYFRFPLSLRLVEEMLLERGILVSYETIRRRAIKFGADHARRLKRKAPSHHDIWHLDEVVISIHGEKRYLWRAVDQEGYVLDEMCKSTGTQGCAAIVDKAFAQARTSA